MVSMYYKPAVTCSQNAKPLRVEVENSDTTSLDGHPAIGFGLVAPPQRHNIHTARARQQHKLVRDARGCKKPGIDVAVQNVCTESIKRDA